MYLPQCHIIVSLIIFSITISFVVSTANPSNNPTIPLRQSEETFSNHDYKVMSEETVYSRWRSVIQRKVHMPNGKIVDFDIIDQKGSGAVLIFAWNSQTKTATLLREYNPAPCRILYGPAAGLIESTKHDSDPLIAAQWELEEECHLRGGKWYQLNKKTVPMDKYVITEIQAYLVIDAEEVDNPRMCDDEEHIEIIKGVTVDKIWNLIVNGQMNLVGGWGCMMALEKLRELGEI